MEAESAPRPEIHRPNDNKVALLDYGAQYSFDIKQVANELGFDVEKLPFDTPVETLQQYGAIILSGGPESVYDAAAPSYDPALFTLDKPILGICYGMQLINQVMGGRVAPLEQREDGFTTVTLHEESSLFYGIERQQEVLMSHGDSVVEVAPGFRATATSGELVAAIEATDRPIYGLQFHPEVSAEGSAFLRRFLGEVAGLKPEYTYTTEDFINDARAEIREKAAGKEVLAFISGGVDSATLAKLLLEAHDNVHLVYVDHGFMREGETTEVVDMLQRNGIPIHVCEAADTFFDATTIIDGVKTPPLNRVTDPEVKRKIIGDTFMNIRDRIAEELGLDLATFMLAQGTLHTDLIESGSKDASNQADGIKSHHNDAPLARQLRAEGRITEPFRHRQKDQVRDIARQLGLSEAIINRQPFPGPGLSVRIICASGPYLSGDTLEVQDRLRMFDFEDMVPTLLPIRTVGIQGDKRTYSHLVGLSMDGPPDWQALLAAANQIPRTIRQVNRVVYLFGEPITGPVDEITPTYLTREVVAQLRHVDNQVNTIFHRYRLDREVISQAPVILFPVPFGEPGGRSIGIRTILTENYKTGPVAVPGIDFDERILDEIVATVLRVPGIARVTYDLTSKPPATIEWE